MAWQPILIQRPISIVYLRLWHLVAHGTRSLCCVLCQFFGTHKKEKACCQCGSLQVLWVVNATCYGWLFPERGYYKEAWPIYSWRAKVAGKELASGHCMAFVGTKSDLKARRDTNAYKHNYGSKQMCDACWATQCFKRACQERQQHVFMIDMCADS